MSGDTAVQNTSSRTQAPKSKTWIYLLTTAVVIFNFEYYSILNQSTASINHGFHLILYEASGKFNENLNSLDRIQK